MDQLREHRRRQANRIAARQGGVISRRQLYELGFTRWMVKCEVHANRWQRVGHNVICAHTGPLSVDGWWWLALMSGGPRAYLDGASSLIAAGLKGYETTHIRVSVPRGARTWRQQGVDVRQTRRWSRDDLAPGPLRRSRNPVAAIRASLWARSQREAALLLTMAVQQHLATPQELGAELLRIRRDRRRMFIAAVIFDLVGGAESMGEIDFARECRRRGLPEPDRQVTRRGRNGSYFLDVCWTAWGVVLEVDGIHHSWARNLVADALRHNDVALSGDTVLRLPLLGLRVAPDEFFAQIEAALTSRGWRRAGRHTNPRS